MTTRGDDDERRVVNSEVLNLNYGHVQLLGHDPLARVFVFQLTIDLW
jgi:hypothetical protein